MIAVTWDEESLYVSGHAGHGPAGQDIVCAAVSILTNTLLAELQERQKDGEGQIQELIQEKGRFYVRFWGDAEREFDFCKTGLLLLQKAYPECVCIT